MKKLYLLLLIAFISISTVSAQVSFGGLNYTTNTSNNTATVASNQSTALLGAITIPATITDGTTTYQVTALDNYCFQGCTGITAVTLPNSITTVGYYCFQNCTGLTTITLPSSVAYLKINSFKDCTGLTSIYNYIQSPLTYNSFFSPATQQTATLYVPKGTGPTYRAAPGWGDFVTIVEMDQTTTGVGNIQMDNNTASPQYFTVYGKKLPQPQKGLNVMKTTDGTMKKILVK